ncbi:Alpha/beta hydrolase fold-1 [Dillenia turbinata]|uniref:Alpha/beta hydrolase fold-1 n=1 Tax=Dillenia turbinata TaxID=194707 RepID=A0AAN8YZQ0_9MAGN
MEQIQQRQVEVRGLKLHVAEIGSGPKVVVFLHGFPEIWYTWRHQMIAVASAGYRAIAFDLVGYGLSDQPPEPEKGSMDDLVTYTIALLDVLGIHKAVFVGKDVGAFPIFQIAVVHADRVTALITLGIPFMLPGPGAFQAHLFPEGFYIRRWREPGRAEGDFGRKDVRTVVRNIYILFSRSELPVAGEDEEIMDLVEPSTPLPPWFTEKDLSVYASSYEKSGFLYVLQVPYRSITKDCGIVDPKIEAAAMLIMGEKDYVIKFPGMEDYIRSGKVKEAVPNLEVIFMPEGSHFVHEQFPEELNQHILTFLKKNGI